MKNITMGDIMDLAEYLKSEGMKEKDIQKMPVYLGDDEELNGIHTAYFVQMLDAKNPDDEDYAELLNESGHNIYLDGKAILIS